MLLTAKNQSRMIYLHSTEIYIYIICPIALYIRILITSNLKMIDYAVKNIFQFKHLEAI